MAATVVSVALDNSTFDLMIVDVFMPSMRGFESIGCFTIMRRRCR